MKTAQTCSKCGSSYHRQSPAEGLCWACARGPARPAAAPIGDDTPAPPQAAEGHTCPSCGAEYANPFPGEICWDCEDRQRRELERRIRYRRASGISQRHAKYLSWPDLAGPATYTERVAKVRKFAESGDTVLALIGDRGLGKTQVMATAVWQAIEAGRAARLITVSALAADLKGRFGDDGNTESKWLQDWAGPYLLCIDEIGELASGDYVRNTLTSLIDNRYAACRPTIIAGNVALEDLADAIGDSVASRCAEGGGAVVFSGWPSFRQTPAGQGAEEEPRTIKFERPA